MDCCWAEAGLLADKLLCSQLPIEVLEIIKTTSDHRYLDALATAALIPKCADKILVLYEPLLVELGSRWMDKAKEFGLSAFCTLARVLPFAPHLKCFITELLENPAVADLAFLKESKRLRLLDLSIETLLPLLLAVFRLLSVDSKAFASGISPLQIYSLVQHQSRPVRYLAIRCFGIYMQMADTSTQKMIASFLGKDGVEGEWEGSLIDYRLLTIWEEKRWFQLERDFSQCRTKLNGPVVGSHKDISSKELSVRTAEIAGVLLPGAGVKQSKRPMLVPTNSTERNLAKIAVGLREPRPLLLTGLSGAGKTASVLEIARKLDQDSSMITLHLNEQTDAKTLIGLYTTSPSGSFVWQPGVFTKAVREGKWILIENIDRAPAEVIGVILPLIERGELLIPNRKEVIRASDRFRLIATTRSFVNSKGEEWTSIGNMLGARLWNRIRIEPLGHDEIQHVLRESYPLLRSRLHVVMEVFTRLLLEYTQHVTLRSSQARPPTIRDLVKWCRRMHARLQSLGSKTGQEPISDTINDQMFLDAVDCFIAHVSSGSFRSILVACIAEEMQISPQRMRYCLYEQIPRFSIDEKHIRLGREVLTRFRARQDGRNNQLQPSSFALTRHSLRTMEQVAAAVQCAEPLLLVGETGIGKTAVIQHLAREIGQVLTVVNLSQQSEGSDLLGGFKPVTTRSIAMPLVEEFDSLFASTFSCKKNQTFLASITKCVLKEKWSRLAVLWREAVTMADGLFQKDLDTRKPGSEQPVKKRKLANPKIRDLSQRWDRFGAELNSLDAQLSRGESKFAFAFTEGKIVKALRNGEWVLLDEVNLATPDTLETISSLLRDQSEGPPSIVLSEAGAPEKIEAHPSFRVFAAMNPATDTGKKDLIPGVRSSFTEIFVQPLDQDPNDVLNLVQTYLRSLINNDERAAWDITQLYMATKRLEDDNHLTDGAGQCPHFSVRTLVRTLMYVCQHEHMYGLRRSIYEGFHMGFLTVLSKDSERLLTPLLDRYILAVNPNSRSLLAQIPRAPEISESFVRFKHYWMTRGFLAIERQPHYIITPFVEQNLLNLVRAISMQRFPILLQGPTSSGKTSMIEYLAKVSGNKFVRINNHEHTDLQEYLGSYASDQNGRLRYQEGVLVEALRNGYWIVLDELNLAPTDVLEALNRLLDDNRELLLPETQEIVRPHPHFILFATQNPVGLYGGRKPLSRAFRNRFLELHFDDIPEDELERILTERSRIAPSFCARIVAVYKKLSILRQSSRLFEQRNSFATLRDLFRWAFRRADDRQQLANNGFMLLAERVRDQSERSAVKAVIEEVMRVTIDEDAIYSTPDVLRRVESVRQSDVVWTPAMRRLFVLVSLAIEHNEPVLLVGETGCGKTQLCQLVAEIYKKHLYIVNAHGNSETGDLIGAQRPVRNRAWLEQQLRGELLRILSGTGQEASENEPVKDLLGAFDELQINGTNALSDQTITRIREHRVQMNSLFTWVDGSLVTAMKNGQHFLLDEISLADDSVLERLNSVLESDRAILLAEKGVDKSYVVASEGFQFLAIMNPGGDYGKRELSAALRNRLTEIWVPPLSDDRDILPILQEKLALVIPGVHQAMMRFARWFKETFQSSAASSVSLRDLLAWASFVTVYSATDVEFGLVHGAAMVYIDTIGANPAATLTVSATGIYEARQQCIDKLTELFGWDVSTTLNQQGAISDHGHSLHFGQFPLSKDPERAVTSDFVFEAPTTMANAMRVVRALQLSKPILLEGSPGVGKTTLIAALAKAAGKRLTRINLSDQTDLMDLFGSDVPSEGGDVGHFVWRDASFLKAMQNGEWVLLDEMNLASQSVLEGLNSCLDHRNEVFVAELGQTFSRHPGFVLFAAQNPHHQGGGRKGLPASFVNRFTVVYTDALQDVDLRLICQKLFPTIPSVQINTIITFVSAVSDLMAKDHRFGALGGPWEVNLRDITRWLSLVDGRSDLRASQRFVDLVIVQRFRSAADRSTIRKLAEDYLEPDPSQRSYFHNLAPTFYQVGYGVLERDRLHQWMQDSCPSVENTDLPIVESLLLCIQQRWPSILVGPSGCGKTRLLRSLAALSGARLVELALNADTDAMDLIGGFDQFDIQRELSQLAAELDNYFRTRILAAISEPESLDDLESVLRIVGQLQIQDIRWEYLLSSVQSLSLWQVELKDYVCRLELLVAALKAKQTPQFTWIDGVLIEAVQQGCWVVLDNANLCNASVLDRINSLLEPTGTLILNEQHSADGSPVVVTPHKNFRIFLTMDPRNGELSRAMRNRAVELYCHSSTTLESPRLTPSYFCESSTSRLRDLPKLTAQGWTSSEIESTFEVALDHLSLDDYTTFSRLKHDLLPLVHESQTAGSLHASTLEKYGRLFDAEHRSNNDRKLIQEIRACYQAIETSNSFPARFTQAQPAHPLINVPHLQVVMSDRNAIRIERTARLYETSLELAGLQEIIEAIAHRAGTLRASEMTRLQRSSVGQRLPAVRHDSTRYTCSFLQSMCLAANEALAGLLLRNQDSSETAKPIIDIGTALAYCRDMVKLTDSANFNDAIFVIFLQIGQELAQTSSLADAATDNFGAKFADRLSGFNTAWSLSSGLSLQRMWNDWRPATPTTTTQLRALAEIESAALKFDSLVWRLQLPLSDISDVRSSFTDAQRLAVTDDSTLSLLAEKLNGTISELDLALETNDDLKNGPYLEQQFRSLCQYRDLTSADIIETVQHGRSFGLQSVLEMLAGRPTKALESSNLNSPIPEVMARLALFGGWEGSKRVSQAPTGTFSLELMGALHQSDGVTLRQMDFLPIELDMMLKSLAMLTEEVSTDQVELIEAYMSLVIKHILVCHQDLLTSESLPPLLGALAGAKHVRHARDTIKTGIVIRPDVPPNHHFRHIVSQYLSSPLSNILNRNDKRNLSDCGADIVSICIACLRLLVPDRALDPALELVVRQLRFSWRNQELNDKLHAIQRWERMFTGQSTNLRTSLVVQDIEGLGREPPPPPVVRPEQDQLSDLQGEFSNILRSIVWKEPERVLLSGVDGPFRDHSVSASRRRDEADLLRTNIGHIVARLSHGFYAYDDLILPVLRTLQTLDLGVSLSLAGSQDHVLEENAISYLSHHTPLLGGSPSLIFAEESSRRVRTRAFDTHLHQLDVLHITSYGDQSISQAIVREVLVIYQQMYGDWKVQLEREKAVAAEKTRTYHYRGTNADDVEVTENDLEELFPTYDSSDVEDPIHNQSHVDPGKQAARLATFLSKFFDRAHEDVAFSQFFISSTECLASLAASSIFPSSPVVPQQLLPGAILMLDEKANHFRHSASRKSINFYTDANVGEARKLVALVQSIRVRFSEIQKVWPEHATPQDVLVCCAEIMAFKHVDPIAKLMTKAEKLHGIVHEWQLVASLEFSAASLYDKTTTLLVSWRRLELSTWARLLDIEMEKCEEDTRSWWFIAYESIVAAPMQLLETGGDVTAHIQPLVATLQDFVVSATIGQFSARLQLVKDLILFCQLLSRDWPEINAVLFAVSNLHHHYSRFQVVVDGKLSTGRQALEKTLREQIQLASWRDTNIVALRESAKRSHHKLFKIVRRFRALLAEPAAASLSSLPMLIDAWLEDQASHLTDLATTSRDVVQFALRTCERFVDGWDAHPARFKNPFGAVKSMDSIHKSSIPELDVLNELEIFTTDTVKTIVELKSQTPHKLTDDNKDLIQHLKTRKHRYFADRLKSIRVMGIPSNLGMDELEQQSDLSVIFANTPSFPISLDYGPLSRADDYFHRLIDIIPQVREAQRKCSDDLSAIETSRSVGYLEGLLSLMRKQRNIISPALSQLSSLGSHVRMLHELQRSSSDSILTMVQFPGKALSNILTWLPPILELSCSVLEVQQHYAGTHIPDVLDGLRTHKTQLVRLRTKSRACGALPAGLSSTTRAQTEVETREDLRLLKGRLESWIKEFPHLGFVLQQIVDWTHYTTETEHNITNGHRVMTLGILDGEVMGVLDKIFVSLQKLNTSTKAIPASTEDASWLMKIEQSLISSIKALHIQEISSSISSVLCCLQWFNDTGSSLDRAVALLTSAMPIIEQYQTICEEVLTRASKMHGGICKMSFIFAKSFTTIASDGFCNPPDVLANQEGQGGGLESGTGLGEGEGAEDISKDVGEEEDLTELAQQESSKGEQEGTENAKDAVDMRNEDMEGDMDSAGGERGSDDGSGSGSDEEDKEGMDEETGSIGDLDPSAVDEKMWDGAQDEQEKDAENSKGKGKADKDEAAARNQEEAEAPQDGDDELSELSNDEASVEDDQAGGPREDMNLTDPFAQQEETLEMPQDLQLDGDNKPEVDTDGDEDMDKLSDVVSEEAKDAVPEGVEEASAEESEDDAAQGPDNDDMGEENAPEEADGYDQLKTLDETLNELQANEPEQGEDANDSTTEAGAGGEHAESRDAGASGKGRNEPAPQDNEDGSKDTHDTGQDGLEGSKTQPSSGQQGQMKDTSQERQVDAFKKLGDVLQEWHRQRREILHAPEKKDASVRQNQDVDMAGEFEHLENEEAVADTQALGAASEEQARGLNQSQAIDDPTSQAAGDDVPPDVEEAAEEAAFERAQEKQIEFHGEVLNKKDSGAEAFINDDTTSATQGQSYEGAIDDEEVLKGVDSHLSTMDLDTTSPATLTTSEEARRLWIHYESLTRDLSLALTEQLRLILAPTLATKMRGDFRTGKRLNIKRIIPYIASQYKRDKIWMRRSVPSKRNYQVMLAVDDSKSMLESGSGQLAFETLALVAKSLSMLEVGDICIVGFGAEEHVRVAHEFGKPFTPEAGMQAFQHFSFQQTYTNVRQLVGESITLFKDARNKAASATVDLWQLELIISDGICEDHDTIRRLVREAQEERIMLVFVIVDAGKDNSIMDLTAATFEPDEAGTGEMKLKMKRYLEGFPFSYYLIVRDVRELPQVLATALKQWFAEVVDAAG